MKTYKITEEQRDEVIDLIKKHSYLGARNILISLEEIKDNKENLKKEDPINN